MDENIYLMDMKVFNICSMAPLTPKSYMTAPSYLDALPYGIG